MNQSGTVKSSQAFRTIAEASDELDVPAHVLRFWEGKFTQIKPLKRAGGRRHYRPDDMALLRGIRMLLQEDGYQIKGVQKLLRDHGIAWVRDRGQSNINTELNAGIATDTSSESPARASSAASISPPSIAPTTGLFDTAQRVSSAENVSPAAGIVLRKALVKLEKARQLLDHIIKMNPARTNTL